MRWFTQYAPRIVHDARSSRNFHEIFSCLSAPNGFSWRMGHAHHFLSRLDRVSLPHVELALTLYRDEGMLRYLFDRARVPQQAERVALSLEDPEEGPFLILTRGGRFVTCLAKGMKASNLPVVTRGQLDAIATRVGELRERMQAAQQLAAGGGVKVLLRRIYDSADELSREDFLAISALQPLYAMDFLRLYFGAGCDLDDARQILLPVLRKTEKLRPIYEDALRSYWQTLWALGNFAVLACMDGMDGLTDKLTTLLEVEGRATLSWPAMRQGIVSVAARSAWAVARIGKPLLGRYKLLHHEAETRLQNLDTTTSIFAIGMRHARLRAEAEKALGYDVPESIKGTAYGNLAQAIRSAAQKMLEIERLAPELRLGSHRDFGARLIHTFGKQTGAPILKYENPDDVPDELALTMGVNFHLCYLDRAKNNADAIMWLFTMIPWIARAAPEDLYLPRDVLRALHVPWRPEQTLRILRDMRDHEGRKNRAPVQEGPARKGPCPCGSGKKYKRCCGQGKVVEAEDDD